MLGLLAVRTPAMGLKDFGIIFDNLRKTYQPGQTITGRIVVSVDSVTKVHEICVKVKGEANTRWPEWRRYYPESTGHEEYFSVQFYVLGSASGGEEISLPIGENVYPFAYTLPPNLPNSLEHEYGHVRYTMKVIIDESRKFHEEVETAFTVVSSLDLNKEPKASEPVHMEMSEIFCNFCRCTAELRIIADLPVRGYVPGQALTIRINVDNQSGVVVDAIKVILRKITIFKAISPYSYAKIVKEIVAKVSEGPAPAYGSIEYTQKLEIPPTQPSNLTDWSIVHSEYNLAIEACVQEWYYKNMKGYMPVIIGTVPLASYQKEILPAAPPSYEEYDWSVRNLRQRGESDHIMPNQIRYLNNIK